MKSGNINIPNCYLVIKKTPDFENGVYLEKFAIEIEDSEYIPYDDFLRFLYNEFIKKFGLFVCLENNSFFVRAFKLTIDSIKRASSVSAFDFETDYMASESAIRSFWGKYCIKDFKITKRDLQDRQNWKVLSDRILEKIDNKER